MYRFHTQIEALKGITLFLIFVAAMSFIVYVAVKAGRKAPQSHQQASNIEKKTEPLWSEAEFRKIYSDYRRRQVIFRFASAAVIATQQGGVVPIEKRKKNVFRGLTAYEQMKILASRYNEKSRQALQFGEFPGDLPKCLDV